MKYECPEMKILQLNTEDVIRTSLTSNPLVPDIGDSGDTKFTPPV